MTSIAAAETRGPRRLSLAGQVVAALLISLAVLWFYPTGFKGGGSDDQRYLETAIAWWNQGPHAGTNHWSLRHPLILSILAAFKLGGLRLEAMALVPRFYALLIVAVSTYGMRRLAGPRAAWLWLALFLASPIIHEMATSCFPEMVELALVAAALWLFWFARESSGRGLAMMAGSGALLGLAFLTRETAMVVPPLLVAALWFGKRDWRSVIALSAGFFLVVGIDIGWLWSLTGDPLYRLHVDSAHTMISSEHMKGGTFHGSPFMNPALAARWIPAGPAHVHWALNPLIDFVIDPQFGLLFVAWAVADWKLRPHQGPYAALRRPLFVLAAAAYVMVCWVFTLRPQPRYFLIPVYAATIGTALVLDRAWAHDAQREWAKRGMALLILVGLVRIMAQKDEERQARQLLPYLAAHPGVYHTDPRTAERLQSWLKQYRSPSRIVASAPQVGDYRLARSKKDHLVVPGQTWVKVGEVPKITPGWMRWVRGQPWRKLKTIKIERRVG